MKRLLTGFICSLFVCFSLAGSVRAQTPAPNPGGYEPPVSCNPSMNEPGSTTVPEPFCPAGGSVFTVPFVAPEGFGDWQFDPGNPQCAIWASAIGDAFAHIKNVCNRTYRDGEYIVQKSNEKHLVYQVTGSAIMFMEDTTWANGERCQDTGNPAMQRPNGIKTINTNVACGGDSLSSGSNTAFNYSPSEHEQNILSPQATQCTNNHAGAISAGNRLVYYGPARCGDWQGNVITTVALPGTAGAGEVMFYCEGKGLCAWYQNIDWSTTSPSQWTAQTDICEGFGITPKGCYVDHYVVNEPMKLSFADRLKLTIQAAIGNALNLHFDIGVLDPQDNFNTDDLSRHARWLDITHKVVSDADHKPLIDNDRINHPSSIQSVICYTDPATGESKRIESKTPIVTDGHPWIAPMEDGVEGLSAYTARTEKPLENGRYRFNDEYLEILGAHPECPERDAGAQPPPMVLPAHGVNTYSGSEGAGSPSVIEVIGFSILNFVGNLLDPILLDADLIPAQACSNCPKLHDYTVEFSDSRLPKEFTEINFAEHGEQTNTFVKPDGNTDTKKTRNEYTREDLSRAICVECSTIPYDIQVQRGITGPDYCGACKADVSTKLGSVDYPVGTNTNTPSSLNYTIPFTNTSCTITQAAVDAGIAYYSGASYGSSTRANMTRVQNGESQWEMINRMAQERGTNPLFALTLWLEETAAGAIGSAGMGCAPGINPSGGSWSATEIQVRCLGTVVNADTVKNAANPFLSFMCRYSGETGWQSGSCGEFVNNPNFVRNVRKFYELLTNATPNLPDECRLVSN